MKRVVDGVVDFDESVEASESEQFFSPAQCDGVDFGLFLILDDFFDCLDDGLLFLCDNFLLSFEQVQFYAGFDDPFAALVLDGLC